MNLQSILAKLKGKEFVSASFYSAIASVIKILTTLIIGKFIALKLGTEGMALFGQLYSFVLIVLVFGGGAFSQGLIKYISEYSTHQNQHDLKSIISTCFQVSLILSSTIGLFLLILPKTFSVWIFDSEQYEIVFYVFGVSLLLYVVNNLLISVVNGFRQYKLTNRLNIISNVITLALSLVFIYLYGITGALLSVVLAPVFSLLVVLFVLRKKEWFKKDHFMQKIQIPHLKSLAHFGLLGIVSYAFFPWSAIVIRNIIIDKVSLSSAGLYELVLRISGASLMFFSLTVTTYFIPKISSLKSYESIVSEIKSVYKMIVPIVVVLLLAIFIFKYWMIILLADESFLPAQSLFQYQLIGDFFKVCAQILSFALVARAKVWTVIVIDVLAIVVQIVLTYFLVDRFGVDGAAMAYMFLFILYFITFVFIFKRIMKHSFEADIKVYERV